MFAITLSSRLVQPLPKDTNGQLISVYLKAEVMIHDLTVMFLQQFLSKLVRNFAEISSEPLCILWKRLLRFVLPEYSEYVVPIIRLGKREKSPSIGLRVYESDNVHPSIVSDIDKVLRGKLAE